MRARASRQRSSSRKESPNSGTGAGKPSAECASSSRKQTRTSSRSEVDGHSDLVARLHHLHWRIIQECREAYLLQGRASEGSGPSLQLESRRKRTPRDRHPRRRRSWRVRLQGARSPSGRPQQFWQVETFEESEVLRDSAPDWSDGHFFTRTEIKIKEHAMRELALDPQPDNAAQPSAPADGPASLRSSGRG